MSGSLVKLVRPSIDDGKAIEFVHGGDGAVLEFLFGFEQKMKEVLCV